MRANTHDVRSLNLTILTGQVVGKIRLYNDNGKPKVVFTVQQGRQRFYVEGVGEVSVREAARLSSGSHVLVVGSLFARYRRGHNQSGLQAKHIVWIGETDIVSLEMLRRLTQEFGIMGLWT